MAARTTNGTLRIARRGLISVFVLTILLVFAASALGQGYGFWYERDERIQLRLRCVVEDAITGIPIPGVSAAVLDTNREGRYGNCDQETSDLYGRFRVDYKTEPGRVPVLRLTAIGYDTLWIQDPGWTESEPPLATWQLQPEILTVPRVEIDYPGPVKDSPYEAVLPDFVLDSTRPSYGRLEVFLDSEEDAAAWTLEIDQRRHSSTADRHWLIAQLPVDTCRLDFYRDDVWIAALDSVPVGGALTTHIAMRPPRAGEDSVASYREIWHWVERDSGFVDEAWQETQRGERIDFSRRHFPLKGGMVLEVLHFVAGDDPNPAMFGTVHALITPVVGPRGELHVEVFDAISGESAKGAILILPCHDFENSASWWDQVYSGLPEFTYRMLVAADGYTTLGPIDTPVEAGNTTLMTVTLYPDTLAETESSDTGLDSQVRIEILPTP